MTAHTFHALAYVVFSVSLLVPLGIGIFFNIYSKAKQTTSGQWSTQCRCVQWGEWRSVVAFCVMIMLLILLILLSY